METKEHVSATYNMKRFKVFLVLHIHVLFYLQMS